MKSNSYRVYTKKGFENMTSRLEKVADNFMSLIKGSSFSEEHVLNIVYGGDGTLIKVLQDNNYRGTYLVIKSPDSLGYFSEFSSLDEFEKFNSSFIPELEEHKLLQVSAGDLKYYAINEFLFTNPYSTTKFAIYINETLLCYCASSGICVATPFGSTGYNHSLGGSVLFDTIGYEYNIIAPIDNNIYHNSIRSICLRERDRMKIVLKNDVPLTIAGDMKEVKFPTEIKEFDIEKTIEGFALLHVSSNAIYRRLRSSFAMDHIKI